MSFQISNYIIMYLQLNKFSKKKKIVLFDCKDGWGYHGRVVGMYVSVISLRRVGCRVKIGHKLLNYLINFVITFVIS